MVMTSQNRRSSIYKRAEISWTSIFVRRRRAQFGLMTSYHNSLVSYWPAHQASKKAKAKEIPDKLMWGMYPVRIIGYTDTYITAREMAKKAEVTSNVEEEAEPSGKRTRKPNKRYYSSDGDDEDEPDNLKEPEGPEEVTLTLPAAPSFPAASFSTGAGARPRKTLCLQKPSQRKDARTYDDDLTEAVAFSRRPGAAPTDGKNLQRPAQQKDADDDDLTEVVASHSGTTPSGGYQCIT